MPSADFPSELEALELGNAEAALMDLAAVFFKNASDVETPDAKSAPRNGSASHETEIPNLEAMYRALVEQIPAIVFMAYLDRGIGEAYISPRIEEAVGFTQAEWLQDPVRWYNQIHTDDKTRWSAEAADMLLTGKPLRSAYRVIARNGQVIWFHCEAKMIRHENGRPWFIHGVAFDITDLKQTEQALQEERNVVSAILDTVGALVVVLDSRGKIIRSNRACELISGYSSSAMRGKQFSDLFMSDDEVRSRTIPEILDAAEGKSEYESELVTAAGERRRIAWSNSSLPAAGITPACVIATGIDITERKRMEQAVMEISSREQRQIGQDLHDGLGQHLTGIAFMSKVLEQKLSSKNATEETADAAKIVQLVNEAIHKTRQLSRGLLPVVLETDGLMGSLKVWAGEMEDLFHIPCGFICPEPVLITELSTATHLYHIAQEAVNNALRHAKPNRILIALEKESGTGTMSVQDDGAGLSPAAVKGNGLGLHIMRYRANIIGGSLDVHALRDGGTEVVCRFPITET